MGIGWLGADKRVCGLSGDVAFYGARRGIGALAGRTAVYADRRRDRGIYHVHGYQEDALGPAKSALLIVVAQILVAYLIEVFGWFGVEKVGFEWRKAIGAAVAIAGIVIFRWE